MRGIGSSSTAFTSRRLIRGEERAARVFLAAGSLGSTELLLRCRDEHRTLPHISRMLGQNWSANANVLSMATYSDARPGAADHRADHLRR